MNARRVAKFLTALAGAGAQVLSLGLIGGHAREWVSVGLGLVTAAAVYLVPNEPPTAPAAANPAPGPDPGAGGAAAGSAA
jgi:hypothetical protein